MSSEKRGSYLSTDLLKEIRGRSQYGAKPIEELLDRHPKPSPKSYTVPSHPMDKLGEALGVSGFEVHNLHHAASELLAKDPYAHGALLRAYKMYLIIAKTTCHEAVEKIARNDQLRHKEKASRDQNYTKKLNEWEQLTKKITNTWIEIRGTIRTRWRRLMKSMEKLVSDDPSIYTMNDNDVILFRMLERKDYCTIKDGNVLDAKWAYLQDDIDIETIDELIKELEYYMTNGGSFQDPQIKKLEDLTASLKPA